MTPEHRAEQVFALFPSFEDYDENKVRVIQLIADALRHATQESDQRLATLVEAAKETRDVAALLCQLLITHGLTSELPSQYDGFGRRLEEAMAALSELNDLKKRRLTCEKVESNRVGMEQLVKAVKAVKFGYVGDAGYAVSGWGEVEKALAALDEEPT